MRIALALAFTLALVGCDAKKGDGKTGAASAAVTASAAPTAAPTATATAAAAKRQMPPRPFPLGSSGPLQPSAPPEQHMMAIGYTIAMVGPERFRLWTAYLAGVSFAFLDGAVRIYQVVASKHAARGRAELPPTRADLYRAAA